MNIASIDMGTNTVLLLIADVNLQEKKFVPILNKYEMPRLGKGLKPGNSISPERIDSLYKVMDNYDNLIREHGCKDVLINATNAMRIASNSQEIVDIIQKRYGYTVNVISGKEEAKLSYIGAISTLDDDNYVVIDIGGGSTEIIYGSRYNINYSESFSLGAVSLTEKYIRHDPPAPDEIKKCEEKIFDIFTILSSKDFGEFSAIGVAGTPTSLASMKMGLKQFYEQKLEGSVLTDKDILQLFNNILLSRNKKELLDEYTDVVKGREDILPAGTLILLKIMLLLRFEKLYVSTRGIRYGAIVDYINRL